MVSLGDLVELRSEKVHPNDAPDALYIGLEHVAQQTLRLIGSGRGADVGSQKQRFHSGDILFGKLRPYFRKVVVAQDEGICSTDFWVLKPRESADRDFIFYLLVSEEFIARATKTSQGSRMPRAIWSQMVDFEIHPQEDSVRWTIGQILRRFDQKIEENLALSKHLEQLAVASFKSWFVDFDPVLAKIRGQEPVGVDAETIALFPDSMEQTDFGRIPSGWSLEPLDQVANYLNGLAMQKYPVVDATNVLPVIKISQLRAGNTIGADVASADIDPQFLVHDGDILFSWSGTLEVEVWAGGRGALNQHLFKVSGKSVPDWFAYLATKSYLPFFRSIARSKATTMGHIQRGHLSDARIAVPDGAILERANIVIGSLLRLRHNLEIQNSRLSALRDALLPQLMSGALRIPDEMLAA